MEESHPSYTVVQVYHADRLFLRTEMSKALLRGNSVFVAGRNKKFGSIYTLAKNHKMKAHTKRGEYKGVAGTFIRFENE